MNNLEKVTVFSEIRIRHHRSFSDDEKIRLLENPSIRHLVGVLGNRVYYKFIELRDINSKKDISNMSDKEYKLFKENKRKENLFHYIHMQSRIIIRQFRYRQTYRHIVFQYSYMSGLAFKDLKHRKRNSIFGNN